MVSLSFSVGHRQKSSSTAMETSKAWLDVVMGGRSNHLLASLISIKERDRLTIPSNISREESGAYDEA